MGGGRGRGEGGERREEGVWEGRGGGEGTNIT